MTLFAAEDSAVVSWIAVAFAGIAILKSWVEARNARASLKLTANIARQERLDKAQYDSTLLALKQEDARQEAEIASLKDQVTECREHHAKCEEDRKIGLEVAKSLAEKRARDMETLQGQLNYIRVRMGVPPPPDATKSGKFPPIDTTIDDA